MPSLFAQSGPLAGERLEVPDEVIIGREDADVVINDVKLSRRHAAVRAVAGGLEVEDLGSTNGTFVDGRRIDRATLLSDGARLRLGASEFAAEVPPLAERHGSASDREILTDLNRTEIGLPGAEQTVAGPRPDSLGPLAAQTTVPARAQKRSEPALSAADRAPAVPGSHRTGRGAFAPPAVRRGGLDTRSWIPAALSYGSAIAVAVALVVYFATR